MSYSGKRYYDIAAAIAALYCGFFLAAQSREEFNARLSPVAMNVAMQSKIAGLGSATATLAGSKVSIQGKFEGLLSPATEAHLREGAATGVRGPAVFDLTVSKTEAGTVTGSLDLTPSQIEALKKGKFYIQIASEKAPDGNLWGWLLP